MRQSPGTDHSSALLAEGCQLFLDNVIADLEQTRSWNDPIFAAVSAMSSATRQRAKRAGVNLPLAKADVTAAWAKTQEIVAFKAALAAAGYTIEAGKKANVWIVADKDGNTIGTVDRLHRKKRHEVQQLMEKSNALYNSESNSELQPLTVGHGRALFEKSKEIEQQVSRLAPLLALLERPEPAEDQDPIIGILKFLESLATLSQHQSTTLAEIDSRLDFLLTNSNTEKL